jgi:acyl-CoA thioesterase
MEDPEDFFSRDEFARAMGIELLECASGRARVKMEIGEKHRNSHGTVHGGAIFTLADAAFALASNSQGIPAAAINASISFMNAAREGVLYALAEEVSASPRLATYTILVTDGAGQKIAFFQGTVYRKTPRPA